MAISNRLKVILKWSALVPIMACLIVTAFAWMFWLDCKPLSDLAGEHIPIPPIPPGAKCYSISRSGISFQNHATVAEDPVSFALLTALLLACAAVIGFSYLRDRRAARKRGLGPMDFS
jgi:hypothetical protein